jgi:hypothetical protein
MVIDVTTNFIRVRQKSPEMFSEYRTKDLGDPGYSKAVVGRLKRSEKWVIQSYLISIKGLKQGRKGDLRLFYNVVPRQFRDKVLVRSGVW